MTTRIKLRRDTSANWASANPILALGEAGYDSTNNQIRVGNGTSTWSSLHPIGGGAAEEFAALTLTGGIPYANGDILDEPIRFVRPNNSENTVDPIDTGLSLKRKNNNGGIYNSANNTETSWNSDQSPLGTEWNADGWGDLTDVQTRIYTTFYNACNGQIGENVVHKEFVMHDTINDKYYKIDFDWWQPNGGGGSGQTLNNRSGFSYTRTLIDTTKLTYFVRPANSETTVDVIETGLTIKRNSSGGGIYNSEVDTEWDPDFTPSGTLWNDEGWNDFSDLTTRTWKPLYAAVHGQLGNHLVNRELVMWDTIHDKYYIVKFTEWGQNNGGSFTYYRREITPVATKTGITFADGTVQKTAYNPDDIKIGNSTISLSNRDLTIATYTDPLTDADIHIDAADDLYLNAIGDHAELRAANTVSIISGDQELLNYYAGTPLWDGSTVVIDDYNSESERSLQLYLNNTYSIWFRTDLGKWYKTYSTSSASYDSELTKYTIPVNVTNTGDPIAITDILLRDPDWTYNKQWEFDRYGVLRPPEINNASTLQLGTPYNNTVITNAPFNDNNRGYYSLNIRGQRGYGGWSTIGNAGQGTEIYIQGGDGGEATGDGTGGEGGNIYLRSGNGQNGGHGGHVRIAAGDTQFLSGTSTVTAGHVFVTAGSATIGNGIANGKGTAGSIYIDTGVTGGEGTQGEIRFRTSMDGSDLNNVWKFNSDGTTQFPTLTVPISDNSNPSGTGQTLKFNDPSQQAIIYGPPANETYTSAQRIILQGATGYTGTNGEGGDIYLWAGPGGDTNGDGGDIKIRAGRGFGTGGGGYLNFQAGNSGTGYGGYINIESGSTGTAGQGGAIGIHARSGGQITLSTQGNNYNAWTLDSTGKTTFPGTVVKSTVSKSGIANDIGPATTLSAPFGVAVLTDGTYGPFTMGPVTFNVTVTSGVPALTVISTSGNSAVNDTIGVLNSGDIGGTLNAETSNVAVASITQAFTPIDLTKSINKLTTGNYTLANGVEGQIMYLVPQTGAAYNGISILVANARVLHNGGSDPAAVYTNIAYAPFNPSSNDPISNIVTLIFTDGAWQADSGIWD